VESAAQYTVETDNLVRVFDGVRAVDGIELRVRAGEFFGFLGPNGAGKTTTIRMLSGMLRPTAGSIRVLGHDVQTEPLEVKRRIGLLPEEVSLYERLTGDELLVFAGRMYGLSPEESARRTDDLLALLDLQEVRGKLIADYSMGMKKKTALAAALIHSPQVLFLDEPFNGIDPISVRAIRSVLRQLTQRGTTIFFSSHVMEVVERLCDRVAIIHRGRIAAEGTIPELREQASHSGDSTLEDVFLTLVGADTDRELLAWLT
jgi:ABC-2 type transport system ATP-binding protein